MQFIPSTWSGWGADGNHDGTADPNNVYDAAVAAGDYLCANGRDLANPQSMDQAILSYNNSAQYLATVKSWFVYYEHGYRVVPDGSGPPPSSSPVSATASRPRPANRGPADHTPPATSPPAKGTPAPKSPPPPPPAASPTAEPSPTAPDSPPPSPAPSDSGSATPSADPT